MDLRFYDVEHGDCCLIISQENESILVDCGYNPTTKFRPSDSLEKQGFGSRRKLHHLILTHPDQDHLADLPNVLEKLKPANVWQHPQLSLRNISDLKITLSRAQEAYLNRSKTTSELQPIEVSKKFKTMDTRQFYLPMGSVRDVNDLSLVTFITEGKFTVCFPGDLTKRGWRLHLQNKAFQYMLRETNLFLASHHGRPTGFYEPVYEYLNPKLIVISDKEQIKGKKIIQRVPYRDHAYGVKLSDGSFRKVLTTRYDGRIRIDVKNRVWKVTTSKIEYSSKR
jgi:beta-lactamase superfamily II metal-dependent hydrolase